MTKSEKAEKNYSTGLNCGQAVLAAFHENAAINEEQAIKIGTGMGAGLCSGDLCGAVNAAVAAISLKYGGQSGEEKMMVMQKTKKYLDEFHDESIDEYLFYSNLDNKPHQLSTDSIALILKQAVKIAREKNESVPKKVHCHMIRKTKAMDLYKNGVPLPFIMQLLGHESMSTTTGFYAFATLEMMSEALNKTFGETKGKKLWKKSIKVKDPYSLD